MKDLVTNWLLSLFLFFRTKQKRKSIYYEVASLVTRNITGHEISCQHMKNLKSIGHIVLQNMQ